MKTRIQKAIGNAFVYLIVVHRNAQVLVLPLIPVVVGMVLLYEHFPLQMGLLLNYVASWYPEDWKAPIQVVTMTGLIAFIAVITPPLIIRLVGSFLWNVYGIGATLDWEDDIPTLAKWMAPPINLAGRVAMPIALLIGIAWMTPLRGHLAEENWLLIAKVFGVFFVYAASFLTLKATMWPDTQAQQYASQHKGHRSREAETPWKTCRNCNGSGSEAGATCHVCRGHGGFFANRI